MVIVGRQAAVVYKDAAQEKLGSDPNYADYSEKLGSDPNYCN
jgi:hypothetical protein